MTPSASSSSNTGLYISLIVGIKTPFKFILFHKNNLTAIAKGSPTVLDIAV